MSNNIVKPHYKLGLTLIELLVVVGILGILLTVVITAFNPAKQFRDAKNLKVSIDVKAIRTALAQCITDVQINPNYTNDRCYYGTASTSYQNISSNTATDIDLCPLVLNKYLTVLTPNAASEVAYPTTTPIGKSLCQAGTAYNLDISVNGLTNTKSDDITVRAPVKNAKTAADEYITFTGGTISQAGLPTPTPTPPAGAASVGGLIGYWNFNETSALNSSAPLIDSSGNNIPGNYATFTGNAVTTGRFGGALGYSLWNENKKYAEAGTGAAPDALKLQAGSLTLSVWAQIGTIADNIALISKETYIAPSTVANYQLMNYGGKLRFKYNDSTSTAFIFTSTNPVITDNNWHQYAVTYTLGTPASIKLYVDCVEVPGTWTTTSTLQPYDHYGYVEFGYSHDNTNKNFGGTPPSAFEGAIDEARIYSAYLSQAQLQQVACNISTTNNAGLIYSLNETSGTSVADSSGNALTGTATNITWGSGMRSNAATFAAGSKITRADPGTNSVLDVGGGESVTLSAWVKRGTFPTNYGTIIQKGDTNVAGNRNYFLQLDATGGTYKPVFGFYNGGWNMFTTSTYMVPANTWTHVAVRHTFGNTNSTEFYINGIKVAGAWTQGGAGAPPSDNNEVWLGNDSTNEQFIGSLDDVRMYKRYLTPEEIQAGM